MEVEEFNRIVEDIDAAIRECVLDKDQLLLFYYAHTLRDRASRLIRILHLVMEGKDIPQLFIKQVFRSCEKSSFRRFQSSFIARRIKAIK